MHEIAAESPLIPWSAPACSLAIGYPARVLDDIGSSGGRVFSLPRGGARDWRYPVGPLG